MDPPLLFLPHSLLHHHFPSSTSYFLYFCSNPFLLRASRLPCHVSFLTCQINIRNPNHSSWAINQLSQTANLGPKPNQKKRNAGGDVEGEARDTPLFVLFDSLRLPLVSYPLDIIQHPVFWWRGPAHQYKISHPCQLILYSTGVHLSLTSFKVC